jgi:S-DNA-T family DNA segregation ATPase FtsK/SpoIIIE
MASRKNASGLDDSLTLGQRAFVIVLLVGWAYTCASMMGFDPADPPSHLVYPQNDPVVNWCGPLGALISYSLFKLMGFGAWALVLLSGVGLLSFLMGAFGRVNEEGGKANVWKHVLVRTLGLVMFSLAISGLQNLLMSGTGPINDLPGGLIGVVGVAELKTRAFGTLGTGMILGAMALVGAIVAMDEWLLAAFSWMWEKTKDHGVPAAKVAAVAAGSAAMTAGAVTAKAGMKAGSKGATGLWSAFTGMLSSKKKRKVRENDIDDDSPDEVEVSETPTKKRRGKKAAEGEELPVDAKALGIADPDEEAAKLEAEEDAELDGEEEVDTETGEVIEAKPEAKKGSKAAKEEDDDSELPGAPQVFDQEALKAKIAKLPIVFGQKNKTVATQADLRDLQVIEEGEDYRFPGLDLLEEPEANFNEKLEATVKEQAMALETALSQFKIDGNVDSIEMGPVITLFHVRLSPGTKVSVLEAVSKDIARVLKAQNVRIVSNMAGRDTVGIEVPNLTKEKVRLKELMSKTEKFAGMKLPMFLGKDASGEPLITDLAKAPHMLIAGTTGSGKSVCMNTIIMSFLYTRKPSELKLVLVDPKMVEMSQFKDIPHLMTPVVTEMGKAAAILEWACKKMDERYELLAEAGCRDIGSYNELPWDELKERMGIKSDEEGARTPRKLPYMVFIIDELADLMMTNKEVEGSIIRIAQKARAVGMHLILATQRPQANVVTGLIKSNMPTRIAFKVASGMDSRIVLDQKGGELLLGQGDMLYLAPSSSKLMRSQGTLVDDKEIRRVVKFMKEVAAPSFERQLMQIGTKQTDDGEEGSDEQRIADSINNSSASLKAAQEDPMFPRAVEIVLETKRGSVSLLQRRLAIGYTRSSRLIDLMGISGIISDHKGSVARDVLITLEDWDAMKKIAAEEAKMKGMANPLSDDYVAPPGGEAGGAVAAAGVGGSSGAGEEAEEAPFETGSSTAVEEEEYEETDEVEEDEDSDDEKPGNSRR